MFSTELTKMSIRSAIPEFNVEYDTTILLNKNVSISSKINDENVNTLNSRYSENTSVDEHYEDLKTTNVPFSRRTKEQGKNKDKLKKPTQFKNKNKSNNVKTLTPSKKSVVDETIMDVDNLDEEDEKKKQKLKKKQKDEAKLKKKKQEEEEKVLNQNQYKEKITNKKQDEEKSNYKHKPKVDKKGESKKRQREDTTQVNKKKQKLNDENYIMYKKNPKEHELNKISRQAMSNETIEQYDKLVDNFSMFKEKCGNVYWEDVVFLRDAIKHLDNSSSIKKKFIKLHTAIKGKYISNLKKYINNRSLISCYLINCLKNKSFDFICHTCQKEINVTSKTMFFMLIHLDEHRDSLLMNNKNSTFDNFAFIDINTFFPIKNGHVGSLQVQSDYELDMNTYYDEKIDKIFYPKKKKSKSDKRSERKSIEKKKVSMKKPVIKNYKSVKGYKIKSIISYEDCINTQIISKPNVYNPENTKNDQLSLHILGRNTFSRFETFNKSYLIILERLSKRAINTNEKHVKKFKSVVEKFDQLDASKTLQKTLGSMNETFIWTTLDEDYLTYTPEERKKFKEKVPYFTKRILKTAKLIRGSIFCLYDFSMLESGTLYESIKNQDDEYRNKLLMCFARDVLLSCFHISKHNNNTLSADVLREYFKLSKDSIDTFVGEIDTEKIINYDYLKLNINQINYLARKVIIKEIIKEEKIDKNDVSTQTIMFRDLKDYTLVTLLGLIKITHCFLDLFNLIFGNFDYDLYQKTSSNTPLLLYFNQSNTIDVCGEPVVQKFYIKYNKINKTLFNKTLFGKMINRRVEKPKSDRGSSSSISTKNTRNEDLNDDLLDRIGESECQSTVDTVDTIETGSD